MVDYDLLKEISENLYDNFISLKNNIRNKDKNINITLRMIAEELLQNINNIHKFISGESNSFYNRIINNNDFCSFMLNEYKCDRKIMSSLISIQKVGNETAHNNSKVFDIKDIKEKYKRLLYLSKKVLFYEYDKHLELPNNIKLDEEIDLMITNESVKEECDEESILNNISKLDKELENTYSLKKDTIDFCNEENINKLKELIGCVINFIISKDDNIISIDDMVIGKYSELYKSYKRIDSILSYENEEDIFSSLINIMCIINEYGRKFNINCLSCFLNAFEQDKDNDYYNDDYINIARIIDSINENENIDNNDIYYIETQKSFVVNNSNYYEIEIRPAINYKDKTRIKTVYSKSKLIDDYATKLNLVSKKVRILGKEIERYFVVSSKIAIRPCEINNIVKAITGENIKVNKKDNFYIILMDYLGKNYCNILDIVLSNTKIFNQFIANFNDCNSNACSLFLEALNKARNIILNEEEGHNVLRYLLGTMNNVVIKKQIIKTDSDIIMPHLDNLMISAGTRYFDNNPFSCNLKRTRMLLSNVLKYIDVKDYKDDFFVKKYELECKEKQTIFLKIPNEKVEEVKNIIAIYNKPFGNHLIYDVPCKMQFLGNYLYKSKHFDDLISILRKIKENTNCENNRFYEDNKKKLLNSGEIDSEEKRFIINNQFNNSKISLIQGEAGSGKTELLCNYITKIFNEDIQNDILFVANTHSALENMRKRVKDKVQDSGSFNFKTVKSINSSYPIKANVLIIDECKTITNGDARKLFEKVKFNYCILAGDIVQLDAIGIGNWFDISCKIFNDNSYLLTNNYRTKEKGLLELWSKVRKNEEDTISYIKNNGYLKLIGPELLKPKDEDEIILCLGYKNTYGINNINFYFQNENDNETFKLGIDVFKSGDPIIFNENSNDMFNSILYNNLKGVIRKITEYEDIMRFKIEVKKYIPKSDFDGVGFDNDFTYIQGNKSEDWTIVEFSIQKYKDIEEDNKDSKFVVPFNISYASSIHKSQGLQYKSVKLVVSNGNEKYINKEEFYTAITRATEKLEIYVYNMDDSVISNLLKGKDECIDTALLKEML